MRSKPVFLPPADLAVPSPERGKPPSQQAPTEALQRAIDLCGGQAPLASSLGLTQSYVWNWLARGRVPAEHCPAIERATARAVRCEDLRPDVDWACLREMAA